MIMERSLNVVAMVFQLGEDNLLDLVIRRFNSLFDNESVFNPEDPIAFKSA